MKITENKYLKKNIKRIIEEIEKWSHIELSIYDSKKINDLFDSIQDFLEYLESEQYWGNTEIRDEKINTKILNFTDNIEDLRKYFGFNIINEDQGKFFKTITILDCRFIITFKNHAPYESLINKKGRVIGPFRLNKGNTSAQKIKELLYKEIKTKLIKKYNLKI